MNIETFKESANLLRKIEKFEKNLEALLKLSEDIKSIPGTVCYLKAYFGNGKNNEAPILFEHEFITKSIDKYKELIELTKKEFELL